MTRDEWLNRYKRRIMDRSGVSEVYAQQCADAEPFEVLSEMFEDEPEEAADEEMSYWTD